MYKIISVSIDKSVVEKFDSIYEYDGLSRSSRLEMVLRQELARRNIPLH
ncbi:MAG: hypothetical protein KAR20_10650 [Candidatus Heimdallarchaeota archaeon]|nr:hypothetical protein [Candidatus Heimdallarchaeota archaeon]